MRAWLYAHVWGQTLVWGQMHVWGYAPILLFEGLCSTCNSPTAGLERDRAGRQDRLTEQGQGVMEQAQPARPLEKVARSCLPAVLA